MASDIPGKTVARKTVILPHTHHILEEGNSNFNLRGALVERVMRRIIYDLS